MLKQPFSSVVLMCGIALCMWAAPQSFAVDIDMQMTWTAQFTDEGQYYNQYDITVENTSADSATIFAIALTGVNGYNVWGSGGLKESCTWAYTGLYPDNPETGWATWSVARYQWSGPGGVTNVGWYMLNSGDNYITEIDDFIPIPWDSGDNYGPFSMVWWNNTHDPDMHTDADHSFMPTRILELEGVSFDGFEEGEQGLPELELCVAAVVGGNVVVETFQFPVPPVVGYTGPTEIILQPDSTGDLMINITSQAGELLNWTLTGDDVCSWITAVAPDSGDLLNSTETDSVAISVDSAGLTLGDYACTLTLGADIGGSVSVPVILKVRDLVNFDEFAMLALHWQTTGCVEAQPCYEVDWYVDGTIDLLDLNQLAQSWLGTSVLRTIPGVVSDTFETGDFSALSWVLSGDADWTVTTEQAGRGIFSARSGVITHGQQTTLELICTDTALDTISFYKKVSSESGYDYLAFYIDDVEQDSWDGEDDWESEGAPKIFSFTPGVHTFKWQYQKDGSASEGADSAWIDDLMIYAESN